MGVRGGAGERVARSPGTSVLQEFHALSLAQNPRKPSKEPTLQKTRLNHQQIGACDLEVASSALRPILAVLGEARPKQGAQLSERAHGIF